MFIEKLILENYQSVFITLKSTRLEIDFTQRKNNICLFIGPNGCGKTSVLSTLTPFATLGNLDIRDNLSIIRPGKKGYKEIIIVDGSHRYVIKHFYTPSKESHSVKSYIEKDGTELNPNGNVSSFKEAVSQELDIEMDYLKLVRLGNNVTNLLDLKATERKTFMSKLLDELDVYLSYNKKISKELLEVKTVINHLLDKIKKTGIDNIADCDDRVNQIKDSIEALEKDITKIQNQIAIDENKLHQFPDIHELKDSIHKLEKKLTKMKEVGSSVSSTDLSNMIVSISDKIHDLELKQKEYEVLLATKRDILDTLYKERERLMMDIKSMESSQSIRSYELIIQNLESGIKSKEGLFQNVEYTYTKDELITFMTFLEKQEEILHTTYAFGKDVICRVLDLMDERISVKDYVTKGIQDAEDHEYENACRIVFQKFRKEYSDLPPCEFGKSNCEYIRFYDEMNEKSLNRSERKYAESISILQCMDLVYSNLKLFFDSFIDYKELYNKMPKEIRPYFNRDYIEKKIRKTEAWYPKHIFNDYLSEITEYDNFQNMISDLVKAKADLAMERKKSYIGELQRRLEETSDRIDSLNDEFSELQENLKDTEKDLSSLTIKLDEYSELKDILSTKEDLSKEYEDLCEKKENYESISLSLTSNHCMLTDKSGKLKTLRDQYQYWTYMMMDYAKLKSELEKYQTIYDDLDAIKYATSTKEGIPLLFIKMYLKDTKDVTNELLDQVYHGRIFIDDFKISPDEFKIPFVNDGHLIEDVSYASQGQISFLSIALSFALSAQSLTKYNIILLDELDAALDTSNREKFIAILEYLIQMIDSEQVFLITHNNMFDMYPVDIVSLTGDENPDMTLANYISVKLDNED